VLDVLRGIYHRTGRPDSNDYSEVINKAIDAFLAEGEPVRPRASDGRPGGLIQLSDVQTIIVPDLHARMDFFIHVMNFETNDGKRVFQGLADGTVQVVCVGDGFHAEGRAVERWRNALDEYLGDYRKHRNMDQEMRESMGLMEMVMRVKTAYPDTFYFLKGNHENIANENGEGNYPFGKFAYEGEMVTGYVTKFFGDEFLDLYYRFEKQLPVMAVGKGFMVTHAEPKSFYPREMVINYYDYPEVIYGLTWTANDAAEEGSVETTLRYYLGDGYSENSHLFGGHRPVPRRYLLRAGGKYVQIHNPDKFIVAYIAEGDIEIDRDVIEIPYNKKLMEG
jgi:hypothetical protein